MAPCRAWPAATVEQSLEDSLMTGQSNPLLPPGRLPQPGGGGVLIGLLRGPSPAPANSAAGSRLARRESGLRGGRRRDRGRGARWRGPGATSCPAGPRCWLGYRPPTPVRLGIRSPAPRQHPDAAPTLEPGVQLWDRPAVRRRSRNRRGQAERRARTRQATHGAASPRWDPARSHVG